MHIASNILWMSIIPFIGAALPFIMAIVFAVLVSKKSRGSDWMMEIIHKNLLLDPSGINIVAAVFKPLLIITGTTRKALNKKAGLCNKNWKNYILKMFYL